MIYYHFNIPTEGPFRCADTHIRFWVPVHNYGQINELLAGVAFSYNYNDKT